MESGKLSELADPKMEGRYDMEQLYKVALTASYCVRQSSIWRPSMTEVILSKSHHPYFWFFHLHLILLKVILIFQKFW